MGGVAGQATSKGTSCAGALMMGLQSAPVRCIPPSWLRGSGRGAAWIRNQPSSLAQASGSARPYAIQPPLPRPHPTSFFCLRLSPELSNLHRACEPASFN